MPQLAEGPATRSARPGSNICGAHLLNAVLKLCERLGKIRPNTTSLGDAPLDKVITIPAAEVGVRNADSGGAWLLFRVGSHDIAALFPERNERLVVAHLLQNSNPQKAPPL